MARATYVRRNGRLVLKDEAEALPKRGVSHVMPDIQPFTTQDGTEITSRSNLRAYERRTGTRQIGNDFASLVAKLKGEH
jgi:hypothetical protein